MRNTLTVSRHLTGKPDSHISPRFIPALIMILLAGITPAGSAPLSPADRNALRQQQQQRLDDNQFLREESVRSGMLPAPAADMPAPSSAPAGPCFRIHTVTLTGTTLLSARAQQKLVTPWLNRCLDMPRITQVVAAVSDWYISRGYITSRAFLTEQSLTTGVLQIAVLEGRLQQFRAEDIPARTLAMTFPGQEGQILNLRDIEQGMEQLNRVRQTPVEIDILPGDKPGWSVVRFSAKPELPVTGLAGFDNSGQKSTGTGQFRQQFAGPCRPVVCQRRAQQ